jgi:hypothetical protein
MGPTSQRRRVSWLFDHGQQAMEDETSKTTNRIDNSAGRRILFTLYLSQRETVRLPSIEKASDNSLPVSQKDISLCHLRWRCETLCLWHQRLPHSSVAYQALHCWPHRHTPRLYEHEGKASPPPVLQCDQPSRHYVNSCLCSQRREKGGLFRVLWSETGLAHSSP